MECHFPRQDFGLVPCCGGKVKHRPSKQKQGYLWTLEERP